MMLYRLLVLQLLCLARVDGSSSANPTAITCVAAAAHFDVADRAGLASALADHALGPALSDLASLDDAEQAELFGSLAAGKVPLGDRSRLRRLARSVVRLGLAGPELDD